MSQYLFESCHYGNYKKGFKKIPILNTDLAFLSEVISTQIPSAL